MATPTQVLLKEILALKRRVSALESSQKKQAVRRG